MPLMPLTIGRPERLRDADAHLEPAGVSRLVTEEDQVERSRVSLQTFDRRRQDGGGALGVDGLTVGRDENDLASADARGVAQLLLGLGRARRENGDRAAAGLDQLNRFFDGALLVGAGGEAEARGVDRSTVGGDVDPGTGCRDPLDADEHSHVTFPPLSRRP